MASLRIRRVILSLILLSASGASPTRLWAADSSVIAVVSSNLGPYQEALAGIQQAMGHSIPVYPFSEGLVGFPDSAQVVIAIGGKAALQHYPKNVAMVYCLAPGLLVPPREDKGVTAKIYMTPAAGIVMERMKGIQPGMQSLGILELSESRSDFNMEMKHVGGTYGVRVVIEKFDDPETLPDRLRSLRSQIDALWLPPDPKLITSQNFKVIKEFCLANRIPFYVPTAELVGQGAVAGIVSSFAQIGRSAALTAKDILAGIGKHDKIYPDQYLVVVNTESAAACGLKIPPDQLKKVDRVIP